MTAEVEPFGMPSATVTAMMPPAQIVTASIVGPQGPPGPAYEPPYIDLGNYGAVGDGVADDTAALQAAIDSVTTGGGVPPVVIALGPGAYRITSTLVIDRKAVTLRGNGIGNPADHANPGRGTTIRWDGAAAIPMIVIRDVQNLTISDLHIQGNDTNIPSEGIYFENAGGSIGTNQQMIVERVRFGYLAWTVGGGYKMNYCVRFGGTNTNNDQFTFRNCNFNNPVVAAAKLDNSQSIWGVFESCVFDGNNIAAGLITNASTTLFNPQFIRCTPDIEGLGTANINVYGWQSEQSKQLFHVAASPGGGDVRLQVRGGYALCDDIVGNFISHERCRNTGGVDLADWRFVNIPVGSKLYARTGPAAATGGFVSIRNCSPSAEYDFASVAGCSLTVAIDEWGRFDRSHLNGAATYVPLTAGTTRISPSSRIINTYSATSVTAVLGDADAYVRCTGTNPTYTLPPNASVAFPVGTQIDGVATATAMTVVAGAGVTVNKARTLVTVAADSGWTVIKVATDEWDAHGDFT